MCETKTGIIDDCVGIEVEYEELFVKTIPGYRERGERPLEPDEDVYEYCVTGVSVCHVDVGLKLLNLDKKYSEDSDMFCDVAEKVSNLLYEKIGDK